MLKQLRKKRASAMLEYMALTMFILITYLIIEKYLVRGFAGRWRSVGDAISHGRQFDPRGAPEGTVACFYEYTKCQPLTGPKKGVNPMYGYAPCREFNQWVHTDCYEKRCDCGLPYDTPAYIGLCQQCINDCIGESGESQRLCADPD